MNMIHLNDLQRFLPIIVILLLLVLNGNVESNPGPIIENESDCLSVFSQKIRSIRHKFDYIKEHFLYFRILWCFL